MRINIDNISVSYGDKKVLEDFSFNIDNGDRVAIIGKSGIGKTTLLNVILGEKKVIKGNINFSEEPFYSIVFQENLLFENRSVYENIVFVKNIDRSIVSDYLNKLGLGNIIDEKVCNLSGGMKRRVAILRAILYSGNIYVFDEILREVDAETRNSIINIINNEIKETIIFTTHNLEDIKDLKANKIINLQK